MLSKSLDGYDTINRTGSITLMVACEYGYVTAGRSLLAMGAVMHYTDAEGDNALTVACRGKHDSTELITILIEYGIDVNVCNHEGDTPLMIVTRA